MLIPIRRVAFSIGITCLFALLTLPSIVTSSSTSSASTTDHPSIDPSHSLSCRSIKRTILPIAPLVREIIEYNFDVPLTRGSSNQKQNWMVHVPKYKHSDASLVRIKASLGSLDLHDPAQISRLSELQELHVEELDFVEPPMNQAHDQDLIASIRVFQVKLPHALWIKASMQIYVILDYQHMMKAIPEYVSNTDEIHVSRITLNAYVYSSWICNQTTTVIVPEAVAEPEMLSLPKEPAPITLSADHHAVTLGPYEHVDRFAFEVVRIRMAYHSPYFSLQRFARTIQVSLWGRSVLKDEYRPVIYGAVMKPALSRADLMLKKTYAKNIMSNLDVWVHDADEIQYKDEVGNISTSEILQRRSESGFTKVRLDFRYPLLGGSKNYFWIRYSTPTSNLLHSVISSSNREAQERKWKLVVPLLPRLSTPSVLIATCEIHVVLPAGATNIWVDPESWDHPLASYKKDKVRSTLSLQLKEKLSLVFENVVLDGSVEHHTITVFFDLTPFSAWYGPIYFIAVILCGFLAMLVYRRFDLRLHYVEDIHADKQQESIRIIHTQYSTIMDNFDSIKLMLGDYKRPDQTDLVLEKKASIENVLSDCESKIANQCNALLAIDFKKKSKIVDLGQELLTEFRKARTAYWNQLKTCRNMIEGKISKQEAKDLMERYDVDEPMSNMRSIISMLVDDQ